MKKSLVAIMAMAAALAGAASAGVPLSLTAAAPAEIRPSITPLKGGVGKVFAPGSGLGDQAAGITKMFIATAPAPNDMKFSVQADDLSQQTLTSQLPKTGRFVNGVYLPGAKEEPESNSYIST